MLNKSESNESIAEGALLSIANNILNLLEYDSELQNEEDLFWDDFYILIISQLFAEGDFQIQPGKNPKEKEKSLKNLIAFLSEEWEVDLSNISANGIIFKQDKQSVKLFLELIEELIISLKNNQEEGEEGEGEGENASVNNKNRHDISQSASIHSISQRLNKSENLGLASNHKDQLDTHSSNVENIENDDDIQIQNLEESGSMIRRNISNKSNYENCEEQWQTNSLQNTPANSCFEFMDFEKMVKIAKQKSEGLDESYARKTYSQNDLSRYARYLEENEKSSEIEDENEYNNNYENEGEVNSQSKQTVKNVSHISEVSQSKEKSEKHKWNIKQKIASNNNSNSEAESIIINKSNNSVQIGKNNRINLTNSHYSNQSINDLSITNNKSIKQKDQENSINNSSVHSSKVKAGGKEYSKKKEVSSKPWAKDQAQNNKSQKSSGHSSNKNSSSKSDISKSSYISNKSNKTKSSVSSFNDDLPWSDEAFKVEIVKELHKLYGKDLGQIFKNGDIEETLNLILCNIKMAYYTMKKSTGKKENEKETKSKNENDMAQAQDYGFITKEFLQKYEKELQYILDFYKKGGNRKTETQDKAVKNYSQNYALMRRWGDNKNKWLQNEINKKRLMKISTSHQLKQCHDVYAKALQCENEKYIEEITMQMEIRRIENEEKTKSIMEAEKYYSDKIAIWNEIWKRERRERKEQNATKKYFWNKMIREKKGKFQRQIDEYIEKWDEEEMNEATNEENINSQEEIEQILNNYKQ